MLTPENSRHNSLAISQQDYLPCYQPVLSLSTGMIEGYESLARFRARGGKLYTAGGVFKDGRYSIEDRLSLDRSLRQRAFEFFASHPEAGYLTINISPGWVDHITDFNELTLPTIEMARKSGIDLSRIVIEITEASGDLGKLIKAVKLYQAVGMLVAIDDFGAGASQIDRIEALRPDIVKLDMRLFKDASRNRGISMDIAMAVHSIAGRIGCHIVCEGVESEQEFNFGVECGCSHVQGFLFARAGENLQNPNAYRNRVLSLKSDFLKSKTDKLVQAMENNNRVKDAVLRIRASLVGGKKALPLDTSFLQQTGVLRYYVCDRGGKQVSANYELREGSVTSHLHRQEMNWSHRSYFALFLAHHGRTFHNIYSSGIYRDIRTTHLCRTYGNFLDDGNLLMVDVKVPDPTLYMDGSFDPL